MKTLHIPTAILTHDGGLIIAATQNDAAVNARLPNGYVAAADTLCVKVSGDVSTQKTAKGELGNLTAGKVQNLKVLHQCLAQARRVMGMDTLTAGDSRAWTKSAGESAGSRVESVGSPRRENPAAARVAAMGASPPLYFL